MLESVTIPVQSAPPIPVESAPVVPVQSATVIPEQSAPLTKRDFLLQYSFRKQRQSDSQYTHADVSVEFLSNTFHTR